jgi:hypothetical protein
VAGVEQQASPVLKGRANEVAVMNPEPPGLNGTLTNSNITTTNRRVSVSQVIAGNIAVSHMHAVISHNRYK